MALKFGFVYDERMLAHECLYDCSMEESPERCRLIYERLNQDGLLKDAVRIPARPATNEEITIGHPLGLVRQLESLKTNEDCENYCKTKDYLWLQPSSLSAARLALGSCMDLVKANVEKKIGNGFAIIRPPGHHSYGSQPQGYCIFSNVAIVAKHTVDVLGINKLMIVDFDIHAANGTYETVKDDHRILLVSSHMYNCGTSWPFQKVFDYDSNDNNIFIPFNCSMNTENDLLAAYNHVIMPIAKEFQPETILVSAGFDSGYYDAMLENGQAIKAPGYGYIVKMLEDLCPNRVLAFLEGGYFWKNYTECAAMMVRGLKGMSLPKIEPTARVNGSMCEVIWKALYHHSKRWKFAKERLEQLQNQQEIMGLQRYSPPAFKLYLGHGFREHLEFVRDNERLKTRQWLPRLTKEQEEIASAKIQNYIEKYEFVDEPIELNVDDELKQMVWDEKAKADCFLRNAKTCLPLYDGFVNYLQSKDGTFECFDKKLLNE
ncbi:hypothetical protein QR680_007283 [Steinernema hermaphroditum]|uniref:Histone deacetylase domain-containing protein n=1 Tax=Steinernema hermaphroditum TaxID=289476 RepID=A0AA39HYC8_9BILA|nr:hypothetical protein QR680_007283 [Steinernema hermaphroditum]